ncbi:MAG: hypothetical protein HY699_21325 [Deltaproteobacteria bacterium]|nr:hypothetical protein [Deltaproteobacteria bacterium]
MFRATELSRRLSGLRVVVAGSLLLLLALSGGCSQADEPIVAAPAAIAPQLAPLPATPMFRNLGKRGEASL